jgi:hypothetical protein
VKGHYLSDRLSVRQLFRKYQAKINSSTAGFLEVRRPSDPHIFIEKG